MCVFCEIVAGALPAHIVFEDELSVAFLDQRPLFPGHTLVVPREHHETLADLPPEQVPRLFANVRALSVAVRDGLEGHGSFVAINNTVSQSVPHLHVHVVPRRFKDGLKGFFWPRQSYRDDAHMADVAAAIRSRVEAS